MNSNNKILIAAGIITLGLAVSSCKKDQDWSTDASHNRAFSVKDDISVDQADTSAEIIFKTRTTGTYTIELAQGTNEGYGLLLKMPQTPTDIESISDEGLAIRGAQKVIIDGRMYLVREGRMFDALGILIK